MPVAEREVDETLVRALLTALPSHLAHLRDAPVSFVAEGWDNSVWRVGPDLAARVPRRELAVAPAVNEARWLDVVAAPLVERGVRVPSPVHLAPAGDLHPFPWLLVTWVEGTLLEGSPPAQRGDLVAPLASVLPSLHCPAPADAPLNPFRGPDLREMPAPGPGIVTAGRRVVGHGAVTRLLEVLEGAVDAPPWSGPRTWCHGDLHPRNLVRTPDGGLGVLDFGDLTAGDPAVDLGVAWTTFTADQREAFLAHLRPVYDEHVSTRAQGWAARFVLGVAGNAPAPFAATLEHATAQLLA